MKVEHAIHQTVSNSGIQQRDRCGLHLATGRPNPSLKLTVFLPLKMDDAWNTECYFPIGWETYFLRGELLVSGRVYNNILPLGKKESSENEAFSEGILDSGSQEAVSDEVGLMRI